MKSMQSYFNRAVHFIIMIAVFSAIIIGLSLIPIGVICVPDVAICIAKEGAFKFD
jgi:hypothetical protein